MECNSRPICFDFCYFPFIHVPLFLWMLWQYYKQCVVPIKTIWVKLNWERRREYVCVTFLRLLLREIPASSSFNSVTALTGSGASGLWSSKSRCSLVTSQPPFDTRGSSCVSLLFGTVALNPFIWVDNRLFCSSLCSAIPANTDVSTETASACEI